MRDDANGRIGTWIGWGATGLFVLFMLMDIGIKLARLPVVDATMAQLGYPAGAGFTVGVIEAACLVLYLLPRTSVLGAVLFTAVFGGAVASHWRLADPLFSHILFGVYLGLFMWGGLWLRSPGLRAVFPYRRA